MSSVTATKPVNNNKQPFHLRFIRQWDLQILVVPMIIYVIIFNYIPMYGLVIAFQDFKLGDTFAFSEWVGFRHFSAFFNDPLFFRIMRNNLVMGALRILSFPLPIIFALMLNEVRIKWFKKTTQTISYLPFFVSWAVAAILMFDFFSPSNGAVNELLMALRFIDEPIHFFGNSRYFWGIFIGTHIWKELGFSAIIFIAAISSVDPELYEAAAVDGAGRFRRMWHITISGIKPTIIILFIFAIGGLMATSFDQVMMLTRQMDNALLRETAEIVQTYTFRIGIGQRRFSFGVATGFFTTLINFTLLIMANWVARKTSETSLF